MPLTRSVPAVGCCRSAITRSIVVLPQPEGPMKETNSPSAICRPTFDSASTLPSAVSNVSETLRTSDRQALRLAILDRTVATAGSSCSHAVHPTARTAVRLQRNRALTVWLQRLRHWQRHGQILANLRANGALNVCACGDINGQAQPSGPNMPLSDFQIAERRRFFDLRRAPSHTLRAASRIARDLLIACRERHEACSLQIYRRRARLSTRLRSRPNMATRRNFWPADRA